MAQGELKIGFIEYTDVARIVVWSIYEMTGDKIASPTPYASNSCSLVQSRELYAYASDAEGGGDVITDQAARKANQDRRENRPPWPLRHVPTGRGRGVATDARRHSVIDRAARRRLVRHEEPVGADAADGEGRSVP